MREMFTFTRANTKITDTFISRDRWSQHWKGIHKIGLFCETLKTLVIVTSQLCFTNKSKSCWPRPCPPRLFGPHHATTTFAFGGGYPPSPHTAILYRRLQQPSAHSPLPFPSSVVEFAVCGEYWHLFRSFEFEHFSTCKIVSSSHCATSMFSWFWGPRCLSKTSDFKVQMRKGGKYLLCSFLSHIARHMLCVEMVQLVSISYSCVSFKCNWTSLTNWPTRQSIRPQRDGREEQGQGDAISSNGRCDKSVNDWGDWFDVIENIQQYVLLSGCYATKQPLNITTNNLQ